MFNHMCCHLYPNVKLLLALFGRNQLLSLFCEMMISFLWWYGLGHVWWHCHVRVMPWTPSVAILSLARKVQLWQLLRGVAAGNIVKRGQNFQWAPPLVHHLITSLYFNLNSKKVFTLSRSQPIFHTYFWNFFFSHFPRVFFYFSSFSLIC